MSLLSPLAFGGAPFQTNGSDISITTKQYPGLVLNPISSEPGGLYSALREINGSQWILQNADIGAAGFFLANTTLPAWAFVLLAGGGLSMYTAPAGSPPGFTWIQLFYVDSSGTVQTPTGASNSMPFESVGVGPNNPQTAVVARFPLIANTPVPAVAVVCPATTAGSTWNIVLDEGAGTGTVPANGHAATQGQQVFAAWQNVPAAGVVQVFTPDSPGAIWPAGHELTLRIATPPSGGVSDLKVVMA